MKYIFISLIIASTLFSCKKKGKADFTLKGTLTNSTFSIPMDGAEVKIYEKDAGGTTYNLISTTTTDGNGNYSFTFPRNSVESYEITLSKNLYFYVDQYINFSDLTIENDNVRDFSTTAMSWAKLRFINQNPQPTDVLKYSQTDGEMDCDVCCSSGEHILTGAIDTTIYCINDGNTLYKYTYLLGATTGENHVTTTAFDTIEILFNY